MRLVIQRVEEAAVKIHNSEVAKIKKGLLVLLGVGHDDGIEDIQYLIQKLIQLRIFSDEAGKMNLSIQDIQGQILVVSQFTLFADTKKGNRPSFVNSSAPDVARACYERFVNVLKDSGVMHVQTGVFGADMKLSLINDGPVTIWMDSKNR